MSLAMLLIAAGCLKDEPLQLPFTGTTPATLEDGWEISAPSAEGFDPVKLDRVYQSIYNETLYPTIRSLTVVRNGKLVSEAYFKDPDDIGRLHDVMSVTKSITSLAAGIALGQGLIESIDAPVYQHLAPYFDEDPVKRTITLRQVLTMETGLDFLNDEHTGEMFYCEGSSLEYVLGKPLVYAPGTEWYYGDGNPQLVSGIIQQVTGKSMEEFVRNNLFQPIGIDDYYWEKHGDGLTFGAFGLWLTPRDMARIGQVMLDKGRWNGQQVVPQEWVAESVIIQANSRDYGFYWYPLDDEESFKAAGQGGQLIWVHPSKQLVVVMTSDSFARSWILTKGSYDRIFQGIYDALEQ